MKPLKTISGHIVDIENRNIYDGILHISGDRIEKITKSEDVSDQYILPGFIDSHIHIESSMLIPSEFAKIAVTHGTIGAVCDPHEIANVCGIKGVEFMIENGKTVPFHFFNGAPSSVPATSFETSGATLGVAELDELLSSNDIYHLSEMMNVPGVVFNDETVSAIIDLAKKYNKPIDGHAPGISSENLKLYAKAGISTDHECSTIDEAIEKIDNGMKILIREGSAARNFDALVPLFDKYPEKLMFCSDDKHPDDLVKGHINLLVKRAVKLNYKLFDVLAAACINPVKHYNLNTGFVKVSDKANFIVVNNLSDFDIIKTVINGNIVAEGNVSLIETKPTTIINKFNISEITTDEIAVEYSDNEHINVIEVVDGEIFTKKILVKPTVKDNKIVQNIDDDVLKLVVVNRYNKAKPAVAFIKGFNLQSGAIASTVAHDSHNIIAVGTNDNDITSAINAIIETKGGICCSKDGKTEILKLPIGGLMSDLEASEVATQYQNIDAKAKQLGCKLKAPFMTLSFMALLVIPEIKLSDKGLFDGCKFEFISL
ncbi:MAG: adenine deaminase [Bacteroidales bacterium]